MHKDLFPIIKKASINFSETPEELNLNSKFVFFNKSNFGVLLFFLMGLGLSAISIIKGKDWFSILIGLSLGLMTLVLSLLSIAKQLTDFVKLTKQEIIFRNSLKKRTISIGTTLKVKMKARTEYVKLKSQIGSGSYFRIVEIFLINTDDEYRIFDFQVDENDAREANILGAEIVRRIKNRINTCEIM